jgi:hypothetical protein
MKNQLTHFDANDLRAIEQGGLLRADAGETLFFARQLEYIKSKAYDTKRPALSAMALIPISTETPEGANTITYRQYDQVGAAKIIANYADDLPRADVNGKEFTSKVEGIGISYGYNVQEIRAAMMTGQNLDARKMTAAERGHMETVNKLAWTGDTVTGLPGFLTNPNIPLYVIPANGASNGGTASKLWIHKTPDQILADLNGAVNAMFSTTKGIHRASDVWLPQDQYTLISSTPRSDLSDTTILEYFMKNNPFVQRVVPVLELNEALDGLDTMVVLENNSDNFEMEIPMLFKQHVPQVRGLETVVSCESRFGGVIVRYPLAFAFAKGI